MWSRCSRSGRMAFGTSSSSSSRRAPSKRPRSRRVLGPAIDLRVDANMAWDVEQALALMSELRAFGIESFEQPIPADDLAGLARLVEESAAGIVVDEGLTDRNSLQHPSASAHAPGLTCASRSAEVSSGPAPVVTRLWTGLMLQLGCQVGESWLLGCPCHADVRPRSVVVNRPIRRRLLRPAPRAGGPVSPSVQFGYGEGPPARPRGPGLGVRPDQAKLLSGRSTGPVSRSFGKGLPMSFVEMYCSGRRRGLRCGGSMPPAPSPRVAGSAPSRNPVGERGHRVRTPP